MKENEEIDQMIKEALTEDEIALFNSYEEQGMFEMIGGLFRGKMKWLNGLTVFIQLIFFVAAIYFAFRFFGATDSIEMIRYGAIFFLLMIAITTLKIFHMMEMNKNATIREIKRIELQVSILANSLTKN